MAISKELEQRIAEARENVESDLEGRLSLGARQRIWVAMGPRARSHDSVSPNIGLRRRTVLGVLSAQLVVEHWSSAVPGDNTPTELTVLARRLAEGQGNVDEVRERVSDFWTRLDALAPNVPAAAYFAGAAAARTVIVAMHDEYFEPGKIDRSGNDREGELPDEWDSALLASASYCAEGHLSAAQSAARRRQFWEWYLTMAVPTAYNLFSE